MNNRFLINYTPGTTPLHKLNAFTKVFGIVALIIAIVPTFDVRILAGLLILCFIGILSMRPYWKPILFLYTFQFVVSGILGSLMILLFVPQTAVTEVGQETIFWRSSSGNLYLSYEILWYCFVLFFKRVTSLSATIMFVLSITPSELAAGLNSIGIPYKFCVIVEVAFRTIPDIGRNFTDIKNSMEMRGMNYSHGSLFSRIKGYSSLLIPLIISSFARVESIANSMDLRSFGKNKKRTWYALQQPQSADFAACGFLFFLIFLAIAYLVFFRIIYAPTANFWCPWVSHAVNGYLF